MQVRYTKAAIKALMRMPANTAKTVRGKIAAYAADPSSQANNVKKLKGRRGFRPRAGDWRIIFDASGDVLDILAIGPRVGIDEE